MTDLVTANGIDEPFDEPFSGGDITGTPVPPSGPGAGGGIDEPFDTPYFTGAPGIGGDSASVPYLWPVAINGHGYMIEPSKYKRQTVPIKRESTDESVEPGEQTLDTSGAWPRSQDNWFLGAGQEYLDNRFAYVSVYTHSGQDPSVRTRFWRSKGCDPWTEGKLKLLPECNRKAAFGLSGSLCIAVGPHLFLWDGNSLRFTDSPADKVPTFTSVTPPAGSGSWPTIHSMTTDGSTLYLALGADGLATVASGADVSTSMQPDPNLTLAFTGVGGSTAYDYYLIGIDANGFRTQVAHANITGAAATLDVTDFIEATWQPIDGIVAWDLLRGDHSHSVATGLTAFGFTDDGTSPPQDYTFDDSYFAPTFISFGNGFLIAGDGPLLAEVLASGMTIPVMKHLNPSWEWQAGCGSPVAIYVAGSAGNVCELYGIQLSQTTFGLDAPYIAGQVTRGEIIRGLCYYEGLVVLSTSLGVRVGTDANSTGHLDSGPVITDPGDSKCIVPYGAFVWFGWSDYSTDDGVYPQAVNSSGLGRISLNEFSSPLVPAYATDVMAQDGVTGAVTSCDVIDGQLYFTVDGNGLWGPSGNVVESGYLESGWVRFGTVEDKILTSFEIRCDPLQGEIDVEMIPFNSPPSLLAAFNEQGAIGPAQKWSGSRKTGEQFMVITTLKRSLPTPSVGPSLRRWTARALITAVRQDQIVVPIIWKETVSTNVSDGQDEPMDLTAEWKFLKGLERDGTAVVYQEGGQSYTCFIDEVELDGEKWSSDKNSMQGLCSVSLLTLNN